MNRVAELRTIKADARALEIGASVTLAELAAHAGVTRHYPVVAQAAGSIAGPTHRNMGTVGGNLCLDTRCIFYNQSEWWRAANNHCLKTTGDICHVAPKSRGVCFATFSGDLAPALMTLGAEVDLVGPAGRRTIAAASSSTSAMRATTASPARATANTTWRCGRASSSPRCGRATRPACARPTTRSASAARSNIRWRASRWRCGARAIRSPICASPSPAPIRAPCCSRARRSCAAARSTSACFKGLDELVRDQIMSMKTTFTPGHYRRRVAGVLARRLLAKLFAE